MHLTLKGGVVLPQVGHPAVEVVQARMRDGSAPGKRRDGFKVGLVVEGGGMRGVVSGAALQAMHDLGLRNAFDAVYGSSAGAINATYFLSGQRDGVAIYTEEIANQQFIDLRRLFKKDQAPALDLGYLLDVMHHKRPLDWQAVLKSDVPLKVVASCLDTLQPVILEDFTSAEDLETCLRASANVPEVAGRPIQHRGRRLVDAAVFEPVPFRAAIADGCTHLITLCSRPPFEGGRVAKIIDSLVSDAVKKFVMNPEYMRAAWMREVENNMLFGMTTDEMLMRGLDRDSHCLPHFAGAHVYPVFPGAAAM
ncbi:FabD/lysophospholipase-like protein [Coccomyxa subellipsoidea C-169]|uniref:Patatin n=1 Tax=Coccomyxa subellipsoidea (strain C-169) TaxID=574566 RepID=I0Z980_COCSC|nr:FabD/lysophospholipase-like protein [Coccomyxa subellipsoidea C-169]EIE27199.1 FabD/lysophospholipase-like protein [Coccomyxa subellipsoidea C-169]|eukprot:XP_005651743.1 FabD/lysophospholipase-like protein [Coccomyxa subellipsoidea C-169]